MLTSTPLLGFSRFSILAVSRRRYLPCSPHGKRETLKSYLAKSNKSISQYREGHTHHHRFMYK